MSVTLTDRDTNTIVLTQTSAGAEGVKYAVAGGTLADYHSAQARHSGLDSISKNSRHNFQLIRKKINSTGVQKFCQVDITISVANDGTFSQDDVDDLVTKTTNYFDAEATTGSFILGVSRA